MKPNLIARIDALQAELNQFIDDEALATNLPGIPLESNRQTITRGSACPCGVVRRLIEAKAKLAANAQLESDAA
jgi:hypothetical protein